MKRKFLGNISPSLNFEAQFAGNSSKFWKKRVLQKCGFMVKINYIIFIKNCRVADPDPH
jgi:hypothetical protein